MDPIVHTHAIRTDTPTMDLDTEPLSASSVFDYLATPGSLSFPISPRVQPSQSPATRNFAHQPRLRAHNVARSENDMLVWRYKDLCAENEGLKARIAVLETKLDNATQMMAIVKERAEAEAEELAQGARYLRETRHRMNKKITEVSQRERELERQKEELRVGWEHFQTYRRNWVAQINSKTWVGELRRSIQGDVIEGNDDGGDVAAKAALSGVRIEGGDEGEEESAENCRNQVVGQFRNWMQNESSFGWDEGGERASDATVQQELLVANDKERGEFMPVFLQPVAFRKRSVASTMSILTARKVSIASDASARSGKKVSVSSQASDAATAGSKMDAGTGVVHEDPPEKTGSVLASLVPSKKELEPLLPNDKARALLVLNVKQPMFSSAAEGYSRGESLTPRRSVRRSRLGSVWDSVFQRSPKCKGWKKEGEINKEQS